MSITKKTQLTKNHLAKKISSKIGISSLYSDELISDIITILKSLIKKKKINIANFGTFKLIHKKERVGRNPKNKKEYIITARKSLSFKVSKKIDNKMNN